MSRDNENVDWDPGRRVQGKSVEHIEMIGHRRWLDA